MKTHTEMTPEEFSARDAVRAGTPVLPVVRLTVPGLPSQCPHCHADVAFALTVFGNQVQASCPACFRAVARLAVTSE